MTDPVLIVGAGPTGLTAALELSRMGVPVRLIDKREGAAAASRATGVQARTLELFEQRGLADEMVRLGNSAQFGSVYGGGKRVFHFDFGHVESRYPFLLFISQAETLVELAELVFRRLGEIRLKYRARLWGRREVAGMPTSKIVFLLVLVAVCVTAFYVRLWMERRKSQERNRPIRD
jgi:2-polyprenyl-6-methoxyphenol hydroxylase-like FAD-dependent oxidoreductase